MEKQTLFSGIQPTGILHIGNYLGAIKQWVELQNQYNSFFCIVDEHAITVPQDPKELHENTLKTAMMYLAAGIDPKHSTIFVQSHVPAHTELGWILNTFTPMGELERMTQFKEKTRTTEAEKIFDLDALNRLNSAKENAEQKSKNGKVKVDISYSVDHPEIHTMFKKRAGVLAGLFNYPTLMAADILLYNTNVIPVGEDQLQHIELTRSLAERFNNRFGKTFTVPKALLREHGARIMGLDDPTKKMSKSAPSTNNYISLLDSADEIRRKIKIAVTDSKTKLEASSSHSKPNLSISNLIDIYSGFTGLDQEKVYQKHDGQGYAEFKKHLAEIIIESLAPLQKRFKELEKDENQVRAILKEGAKHANEIAEKTLLEVKEKMGFLTIS